MSLGGVVSGHSVVTMELLGTLGGVYQGVSLRWHYVDG